MAKNTILIVIDSLLYDKTIKQPYRNSAMPFLDELRKKGIDYQNMYSEAPYTEAALVSLLSGQDTLKNGGYIKKLYNKETIMETFKKNGYDTFCNCTQPLVSPKYSYPGVTDEYCNVCYEFETIWSYRLQFYSNLFNNGELNNNTIPLIIDLLEDNLTGWLKQLLSLKNKEKLTSFIDEYVDKANIDNVIKELEEEIKKFNKNKEEYTKEFLKAGKEHQLFKIHCYNLSKKMTVDDMKRLYKKYKPIIHKMQRKNIYYNLKNNHIILNPKEERRNLIKAYLNAIYNRFLIGKIDYKIKSKKAAPSMDTTIHHFENWLETRTSNKPYFAYIHVDDCHSHEIFYTYDSKDYNQLDEEFNLVQEYMNNMPKNYYGSISYDVSLQYADLCLKRLYNYLEKNNLLDNVNIAICADHGSSYTFAPYRSNYVNNVHRENYNMPFVIWSKDIKHRIIKDMYNTKDIPATILDLNNIKIPNSYDGISTLNSNGREYVLLENVPGGCPDYNYRDFWLGVRNKKYLLVINGNINKNFKDADLFAIYDLKKDSEELHNLKNTIDYSLIKQELNYLEKEYIELVNNMTEKNFLNEYSGEENEKN